MSKPISQNHPCVALYLNYYFYKQNVTLKIPSSETGCTLCQGGAETVDNLFYECPIASCVWYHVLRSLQLPSAFANSSRAHYLHFLGICQGKLSDRLLLQYVWFSTIWCTWIVRNDIIFRQGHWDAGVVIDKIKLLSWLWLKSQCKGFVYSFHNWEESPLQCLNLITNCNG